MRNLLFILAMLVASTILVSCSDDDDQKVNYSEVPETAKTFLKNHLTGFNEADIRSIEKDKDGTYEVRFKNNMEIDFYANGVWKDIDLNGNTLPASIAMLLPENALNYISSTYPAAIIEDIEKTGVYSESGQGFKIELRDDRDIYFDAAGNVLQDKGQTSGGKETVAFGVLPTISQEFLNTYFEGQTPSRIEKEWNIYEIEYNKDQANEIEVEFFTSDGSFKSVETGRQNEAIRAIIQGVSGSRAILEYLDTNHSGQTIEEFSVAASGITIQKGYVVEIGGKTDYKIYFDETGKHLNTVRD